jgi:Macrocin-O-methyltransferase (TylF)
MKKTKTGFCHAAKHTAVEKGTVTELVQAFETSTCPVELRLQNFPRHVRRQDIARFLVKNELFKSVLPVHGSVVECGVYAGGGLMTWVQLSSIYEPYNHTRRVIGFDTFAGFPGFHANDAHHHQSEHLVKGGLKIAPNMQEEINHLASIHDRNRPLGHIPKIELIAGDACKKIPQYVKDHPHLLVSLLYLDFDIFKPTKVALEHLYPRIVKGGIVAFDELHCPEFPGETTALLESFDLREVELRRLPIDPYISYFVK